MNDDCMGCREPGYSHAAYCPEGRVEDLRKRLADSERLREDERLTWDAQHKRQASMNAHLAALVTDAQEELRKCQQDAIQLQARLAEAEERIRNALDALNDDDEAGAHLILYECVRKADSASAAPKPRTPFQKFVLEELPRLMHGVDDSASAQRCLCYYGQGVNSKCPVHGTNADKSSEQR